MKEITDHIAAGIAEWVLYSIWNNCEDYNNCTDVVISTKVSEETGLPYDDILPLVIIHLNKELNVDKDDVIFALAKKHFFCKGDEK